MQKNGLNGNVLKLIACLLMLIDHLGLIILTDPQWLFLRYIGRLSFPIFAFFIAEGCKYTRNKTRYFLLIAALGILMTLIQYLATNQFYGNVFITFSFSIVTIYIFQWIKKQSFAEKKHVDTIVIFSFLLVFWLVAIYFFTAVIPIDYGFWGVLLPFFFSIPDTRNLTVPPALQKLDNLYIKIALGFLCMVFLTIFSTMEYQWICFFTAPLLLLYNGERGKYNIKYFFYAFYPVHLVILYLITLL